MNLKLTKEIIEGEEIILEKLAQILEGELSVLIWQKNSIKKAYKTKIIQVYENLGLEIVMGNLWDLNQNEVVYFYCEKMDLIFKAKVFKRRINSLVLSIPRFLINVRAKQKQTLLKLIKREDLIPSSETVETIKVYEYENRRGEERKTGSLPYCKIKNKLKVRNQYKENHEIPLRECESYKLEDISAKGLSFTLKDGKFKKGDIIQIYTARPQLKLTGKIVYIINGRVGVRFMSISHNQASHELSFAY